MRSYGRAPQPWRRTGAGRRRARTCRARPRSRSAGRSSPSPRGAAAAAGARTRCAGETPRAEYLARRRLVRTKTTKKHTNHDTHATATPAHTDDHWISPIDRAAFHLAAYTEAERPYSTPARPRDLTGELQLACEHLEGRPCGDGAAAYEELDARAGFADWLPAGLRVRTRGGTADYGTGIDLDRAHVDAHWRDFGFEVGRDVFAIGPGARTQVGGCDNAPPRDFVRSSYA